MEGVSRSDAPTARRRSEHGVISTARIFFAKGKVMAKALGTTPEEEHRLGIHKLAKVRLTLRQKFILGV